MYEEVLIVGIEYTPLPGSERSSASGRFTISFVTAGGERRTIGYFVGFMKHPDHDKPPRWALRRMPTGTLAHFLGAAGILPAEFDRLFLDLSGGHWDHAFQSERLLESRAMQVIRVAGTADETNELAVSKDLLDQLVGRIVRADMVRSGRFWMLAPHPMAVLPSRNNGSDTFAGRPVREWLAGTHTQRRNPATADRMEELRRQAELIMLPDDE